MKSFLVIFHLEAKLKCVKGIVHTEMNISSFFAKHKERYFEKCFTFGAPFILWKSTVPSKLKHSLKYLYSATLLI